MPTNNNICQEVNFQLVADKIFVVYGTMISILAILKRTCAKGNHLAKNLTLEEFTCTSVLIISFHFDMFNSRRYGDF